MPNIPLRPCTYPGCSTLVTSGRCEKHIKQTQQRYDSNRPDWHKLYNCKRWRVSSKLFLQVHPLCMCKECKSLNRILPATVVDHIKDHKGNLKLFWDTDNWQAMNDRCHNSKTAKTNNKGFKGRDL